MDSLSVGKPVSFSFSFVHPQKTEVFFPDTSANFAPFEIIEKISFNSVSDKNQVRDSAIYKLVSFDVDSFQVLSLPVYLFNKGDCTAVFAPPDTVFLKKQDLETARRQKKLVADVKLSPLADKFNFFKLTGSAAIGLIIVIVIYWVFGKDISVQWQLLKLQRRHFEFKRAFNRLFKNVRERGDIGDLEKAVIVWKNYLERLEKKPFATYTTREIIDNMPDENLALALKRIDGMIYGQVKAKDMDTAMEALKSGATKHYKIRRKQVLARNSS